MYKITILMAALLAILSSSCQAEVDAARLRSYLNTPGQVSIGLNLTHFFFREGIVANPKAEMARVEKKLTGKPEDAPLHLEMADYWRMLNHTQSESRFSDKVVEESKLAAEQYEVLLEQKPDDPVLLLGYANALSSHKDGRAKAEPVLRKLIDAHPEAWEARLKLAEILDHQALNGRIAYQMAERSRDTPDGIRMNLMSGLPEPLTQEEADKLYRESSEQYDLAVSHAPDEAAVYLGRFSSRFNSAFSQFLILGVAQGEPPAPDMPSMIKMVIDIANPSDLRKAWEIEPQNPTILRALVACEGAGFVLDQPSLKLEGLSVANTMKRTWASIPEEDRSRLRRYEEDARKAISRNPKDVWAAHEALGMLKLLQGESEEAEKVFRTAAGMCYAADISYFALFALISDFTSDTTDDAQMQKIIPIWEMRVRLSESVHDMLNLAGLYTIGDRLDKAEEMTRRVLENDPENRAAHGILGVVVLKRQGDPKEAVTHLEKAVAPEKTDSTSMSFSTGSSDDSKDDDMRINLAVAYAITGDADRARGVLTRVRGEDATRKAKELLSILP